MATSDVGVALIGTGGIGEYHARLWPETPHAKLVGVFDVRADVAKRVAAAQKVERVYASLEEALADPDVGAVDVCVPNKFHAEVVIAALDAGKHCICEKPLAADPAEIEQMIAARDRSSRILMTAQHMRFEQRTRSIRKLLDAGDVGDVYYTRAWWLRRRMAPTTPGFLSRAQGVHGPGLDIGVHVLDLALHLMDFPKPVSVTGISVQKLARQPDVGNQWGSYDPEKYEVEDFASGFVRFENGGALSLEVSWLLNMPEAETFSVALHGTRGGARWPDCLFNQVRAGVHVNSQLMSDTGGDGHKNELAAFTEAVRSDGPSPVPAEQSLIVARVLAGLYESAESGRELRL